MPEDASGAARVLSDGVSPGGGGTVRLRIHGMTCGSCVARVERALRSVTGVGDARVNLTTEVATIELGTSTADRAALVQAIRDAGYDAETFRQAGPAVTGLERTHEARLVHQKQAFVQALALGVPIVALQYLAPVLQSHGPGGHVWPRVIQAILAALLLASSAGAPILVGGLRAVTHGSANMDLLVSLGVVVAFVGGVIGLFVPTFHAAHFHAVGMILAFINLGRYFEIGAKRDASGAISALVRRMPTMAQLVTDDTVAEVPIASIRVGDRVRVAQDMLVPVDGRIVDGHAAVDESAVTGEALPRPRRVGDSVCSGSVVADGLVTVEATHVGDASTMGRIVRAVEDAQSGKTRMQRIADRVAAVFVPVVIALSLGTFAVVYLALGVGLAAAVTRAVAVLVIACPCAMGLATPTAVLVSTSAAALRGILVRDAAALEAAGGIDVMLLDKTGTLTHGRPVVSEVFDEPVGTATLDAREVIRLAASAEQYAQHPFARAIVAQAREWNIQLAEPTTFSNVPARGVAARIDDRDILVGGSGLLRERGVDISLVASRLERVVMDGQSAVLLAVDGACAGLIGISDRIRTEASRAIEGLSQLGVATAMVTGDQAVTATAVAGAIGVGDVHAEMSPEDKCALVQARRDQGQCVAFVGDGINDAPALATADVGITFASATDVAAGAADVTILHDDLMRLPDVVLLARRGVRVIKQNLFWAFFYNVVAIPAAMLGKVTPGVAAAAMMCSSISVVLNSLRLRRTHHAGGATESHAASHGAQASS